MFITVSCVLVSLVACALKKNPSYRSARRNGADYRTVLRVVDDGGHAVSDAKVRVLMGMNFIKSSYFIEGTTDTNGLFTISGRTTGNEIVIDVTKDGYYGSRREHCLIAMGAEREVRDGGWQPYGAYERMELRRIRHPTKLVRDALLCNVPGTNAWYGVDMKACSLVSPHGNGTFADFEVRVQWDGRSPLKSSLCAAEIRFPREMDGGVYAANVVESQFPYVYEAGTNDAYSVKGVSIIERQGRIEEDCAEVPFRKDSVLVTRTRSRLGEDGHLLSACYGLIRLFRVSPDWNRNPVVHIAYIFNPTPNDTNLEAKR